MELAQLTIKRRDIRERERVKWAIHLFAKEKVVDINAPTDMPSVDEVLRSLGSAFDLPRNLGRLTRFLLSSDRKQRLRGLQVLHRRFLAREASRCETSP